MIDGTYKIDSTYKIELPIGFEFKVLDKHDESYIKVKVVESDWCNACLFSRKCDLQPSLLSCANYERSDEKNVVFEFVKE